MKIAIIGAGEIGATLTRHLAALGHHVTIANSRGPESLAELATETGAHPVAVGEIGPGADLLIVAVPPGVVPTLASTIAANLPATAVIIDTGNYVPGLRDVRISELDEGGIESRWTERQLGRPVVKVFNTIQAAHLATGALLAGDPARIALPVAGDDARAKAIVIELTDQLGFDGFDAGGLDDSWRQQPGTPIFTTHIPLTAARDALSQATAEQTQTWRATAAERFSSRYPR